MCSRCPLTMSPRSWTGPRTRLVSWPAGPAAGRGGDFEALLQVLDPDVVFRMDLGPVSRLAHRPLAGAVPVARQVLVTAPRFVHLAQPVLVNGEAGALFGTREDPVAVVGFTIAGGRIAALNLIADQDKLRHLTIQP